MAPKFALRNRVPEAIPSDYLTPKPQPVLYETHRPQIPFLKEEIANGVFDLRPVKSTLNIADIFIKALPGPRFQELRTLLNAKRVPDRSS